MTLPRPTRVCSLSPPRRSRALGCAGSSSGHSCQPSPPCTLIVPWAGGRGEPGPCIIPGLNGPAARAGRRAGGGAADLAGVWPRGAGALLSSPPASAGSEGWGLGESKGHSMGWIRPSSTPSCNFSFGFPGLCTQSQPPGPAPGGVAVRVSAAQAEVLDFILFFYVPLPLDTRLLHPGTLEAPRAQPQSSKQAPGSEPDPFPGLQERDGGGDPRSRAGRPPALGPFVHGMPLLHC